MNDIKAAQMQNAELRKIQSKILKWDDVAKLKEAQHETCIELEQLLTSSLKSLKKEAGGKSSKDDAAPDPIDSTPKFLDQFDEIDDTYTFEAFEVYAEYTKQLEIRHQHCEFLLSEIESTLKSLHSLTRKYDFVNTKTSSLNSASEKLTRDQQQLNDVSIDINFRLKHFTQADHIAQRLQNPTFTPASVQFADIVNSIDECMDYLKLHPQFKETTAFNVKHKQCLLKAIQMIKSYVIQILTVATDQVLNPKAGKEVVKIPDKSSEAAFALFYGKFQASSAKIRKIIELVENRFEKNAEYENLLSDLHHFYLSQRAFIMSSGVDNAIKDLCRKHKGDHCALVRSSCTFLVHICQDEHRLFYQFFSVKSPALTSYMEGLCTILYDTVRPFIIHINHLETLAEICSILRVEMLDEHVQNNAEALETFGKIIEQLLQDVQERLVFRAHLYLQTDIQQYHPSPGDLAYPEKLEMMESIAMSLQESQPLRRADSRCSMYSITSTDVEQQFKSRTGNSPADLHGMWYPTVRRTLVCLSRLYRCIDRPIFQSLSQEALTFCIQSLTSAANSISANKTTVDGKLFEIKHLLILREQIAPFRVDFTAKETSLDFSKVKTAAYELLQKRKQLFALGTNNAILEFLLDGAPQVKEHLLDSRKDVDRQLKLTCEQFIKDVTKQLVDPVLKFIDNAQNLLKLGQSSGNSGLALRQTPWAAPQQISSLIQESQRNIKNKMAAIHRALQLYLSNKDTEFILFRPIRNNVINAFERLKQLLMTNGYSKEDMIIVSIPTADQVSVMISSASLLAESNYYQENTVSRKVSTSSIEKKVSFDRSVSIQEEDVPDRQGCVEESQQAEKLVICALKSESSSKQRTAIKTRSETVEFQDGNFYQ